LSKLRRDVLMNASVGGRIYGLYQERPASRQGIIYRKDWADRLGLKAPSTIDELYGMLKQFTENDPDGNGRKDTIGLADRGDLVYGAFKTVGSYFGTPNGWGIQNGKLLPEFMFPAYVDTMNFFRKLHKEGLINQAFPVTSKADQQELLTAGKAGLYIGTMGDVLNLNTKAQAINPAAELDVQNRIKGPKGYGIWAIPGYGSVVLFPKTAIPTETELKEVLQFFDSLMSPELANLIYWGVEGKHYTLKDGKAVPSDDLKLTETEVRPYLSLQIGGPRTIDGLLKAAFQLPAKVKSDTLSADNDKMLIKDPTWPLDSETYNMMGRRLQDIITDATYQYILGIIDEAGFKAAVDRWMKQGGSRIIEEFNDAYRQSGK
jgi:putative aldouronate transport system substrate-binding protein